MKSKSKILGSSSDGAAGRGRAGSEDRSFAGRSGTADLTSLGAGKQALITYCESGLTFSSRASVL
jgi:hypothetical protein